MVFVAEIASRSVKILWPRDIGDFLRQDFSDPLVRMIGLGHKMALLQAAAGTVDSKEE
jgi:hypothetical protein